MGKIYITVFKGYKVAGKRMGPKTPENIGTTRMGLEKGEGETLLPPLVCLAGWELGRGSTPLSSDSVQ